MDYSASSRPYQPISDSDVNDYCQDAVLARHSRSVIADVIAQKTSFSPNCNCRMSVRVDAIRPNVTLDSVVLGSPQFG